MRKPNTREMQLKQIDDAIQFLKMQHQAIMTSLYLDVSRRTLEESNCIQDMNQRQSNTVQLNGFPFLSARALYCPQMLFSSSLLGISQPKIVEPHLSDS